MTDRTVPTEPTLLPCPFCGGEPRMVSGGPGCTFIQCSICNASGDDGSEEYAVEKWNRRAASPAAPGAEVEPVAKEGWRLVPTEMPLGMMEAGEKYLNNKAFGGFHTLPAQFRWVEFWAALLDAYASPPTTDAIKAQARREALEEAARLADDEAERWGKDDGSSARVAAAIIRRLAGKPGEAEPTDGPVVVYRPQRASLAEAMSERVAFYSIEAFKRHVLNEWPQCGSIAVEPYGGIDKRIGWDTHLVSVDGMAVGFTDRAIPGLAPPSAQGGEDGE